MSLKNHWINFARIKISLFRKTRKTSPILLTDILTVWMRRLSAMHRCIVCIAQGTRAISQFTIARRIWFAVALLYAPLTRKWNLFARASLSPHLHKVASSIRASSILIVNPVVRRNRVHFANFQPAGAVHLLHLFFSRFVCFFLPEMAEQVGRTQPEIPQRTTEIKRCEN